MTLKVCIAGATGWAGSALAKALITQPDLELVSGISRSHAGSTLGQALQIPNADIPLYATVAEALKHRPDVLVEYTKPTVAKENVLHALQSGVAVVIGTSGLSDADYDEIADTAEKGGVGVLAAGNFALTAVLLQKFAEIAAGMIPQWEILDYASDRKIDSPSGTVRELANRLSQIRTREETVPVERVQGVPETRGAEVSGSRVHSVRLPGYVISLEVLFGMKDQRLSIRHDSGNSAEPYIDGALLAIRKVRTFTGLRRGLDKVLEL